MNDDEAYCVVDGCDQPATHLNLYSITEEGTPIFELVCCKHLDELP